MTGKTPDAPAFVMPDTWDVAEMLRYDLGKAGIDGEDQDGCIVDLHLLRHTFISSLARSGIHPKTAQALAEHSDINLTLSRYTHSVLTEQADAIEPLPSLTGYQHPWVEVVAMRRAAGAEFDANPVVPPVVPDEDQHEALAMAGKGDEIGGPETRKAPILFGTPIA